MKRNWVQWSSYDLNTGLGGVEVHARSLARELEILGWDTKLAGPDLQALSELKSGDVLQTHGSSILPFGMMMKMRGRSTRPFLLHTLHGTTLGRMWACGEWWWIGGYLASLREILGVLFADGVAAVHGDLWLFRLAAILGKKVGICGNGWDAGARSTAELKGDTGLLQVRTKNERPCFVFIGRGEDPVKNRMALIEAVSGDLSIRLLEIPKDTGPLSSSQVLELLSQDSSVIALVLPSHYEGLPLVVLEALSQGVRVAATQRGGLKSLDGLLGLDFFEGTDSLSIKKLLNKISDQDQRERLQGTERVSQKRFRAEHNRKKLKTWREVANNCLEIVGVHC